MSIEIELWNIFTYYTLYGNPLDPEHMNKTYFMRLCKDCQLLAHLSPADINILYQTEVKRSARKVQLVANSQAKRENPNMLTHSDFLNLLLRISGRIYPEGDPEVMFQKLLMENILPLAPRRQVRDISRYVSAPEVRSLVWDRFGPALRQICRFYMGLSDQRRKRALAAETRQRNENKRGQGQLAVTSRRAMAAVRSQRGRLAYKEFVQFSQDYRVTANALLTTIEVGDAYLCTVQQHQCQPAAVEEGGLESQASVLSMDIMGALAGALAGGDATGGDTLASLDEEDFLQVLVRMSLKAYESLPDISAADKIKGFLLLMWRHVTKEDRAEGFMADPRRHIDSSKGRAGDLNICGSALFNQVMMDMWREDDYRDYLHKSKKAAEQGKAVLRRLATRSNPTSPRSPSAASTFETADLAMMQGLDQSMIELSVSRRVLDHQSSSSPHRPGSTPRSRRSSPRGGTTAAFSFTSGLGSPRATSMRSPSRAGGSPRSSPRGPRKIKVSAEKVRQLLLKKPELGDVLYNALKELEDEEQKANNSHHDNSSSSKQQQPGGGRAAAAAGLALLTTT